MQRFFFSFFLFFSLAFQSTTSSPSAAREAWVVGLVLGGVAVVAMACLFVVIICHIRKRAKTRRKTLPLKKINV